MIGILQNLVVALSANADIKVVLIALLFGLMVVGLVLGQALAFVRCRCSDRCHCDG